MEGKINKFLLGFFIFVVISAITVGAYLLGSRNVLVKDKESVEVNNNKITPTEKLMKENEEEKVLPTEKSAVQKEDKEDNKMIEYKSSLFSLKYPQGVKVSENQEGFVVISNNEQMSFMTIDSRKEGIHAKYEDTIKQAKEDLVDMKVQELSKGVRISGKMGPGYGEGRLVNMVVFKSGDGAIVAETSSSDDKDLQLFDSIVSTIEVK